MISIERIYEKRRQENGYRILVDRMWPRGIRKKEAKLDLWLKDVAPSGELRKRFNHKPEKWEKFKEQYFKELKGKEGITNDLIELEKRKKKLILIYSARDEQFNQAAVLKEFLESKKQD